MTSEVTFDVGLSFTCKRRSTTPQTLWADGIERCIPLKTSDRRKTTSRVANLTYNYSTNMARYLGRISLEHAGFVPVASVTR